MDKQVTKVRPLGAQTPHVFVIEVVHGCNLSCHHCAMSVLDRTPRFMTRETWRDMMRVVARVAPTCRVELAMGGEPTLHDELVEMIREGRAISPGSQFQITTNGTMLISGKVRYADLFAAGLNVCYTDMYQPREKFRKLAEESGTEWWFYYPKEGEPGPEGRPSPWTYYGPHFKCVVLQENPANWPDSRRNSNLLGSWMNHLDFNKSARFGIEEVKTAPRRRCNQPFTYAPVSWTGDYILCCQDMALETVGHGNVSEGPEGFLKFWFGEFMQKHRRWLRLKDRNASPFCGRCSITFSRCDYLHWTDEQVDTFWDGARNVKLPSLGSAEDRVDAPPALVQLGTKAVKR